MSSPAGLRGIFNRSVKVLKDGTMKVLSMSGADEPERARRTIFKFANEEDLSHFVVGSDADIGGCSTAKVDLTGPRGTARFYGNLSLDVQPKYKDKLKKSGYVGLRNKRRTTLFSEITEDLTFYDYLVLRVRGGGDPRTRHGVYVNLQTVDAFRDELWRHKLVTLRNDGGWEDVYIPFDSFKLHTSGHLDNTQVTMDRRAVWMFGFSLNAQPGIEGEFELGVHSIDVEGDPTVDISEWERLRRPGQHHARNKSLEEADDEPVPVSEQPSDTPKPLPE